MSIHDGATVWITGDVELPQALLNAQAAGRLVLFIGAGASVADPSNLPLFNGLASELADLARVRHPAKGEALDLFLGSMPSDFDVHRHARDLIARRDSEPNETHEAIVRLATAVGPVRIVTTNFDDHLAAAAAAQGQVIADKWVGPALPLGDDFAGLVHLHGSVLREPRQLVLTDEDFGRAYLTHAWATRFLMPMFQRFTVLFVGYSHDDPLMRYLALGLPSGTPRFAFTSARDSIDPKWQRLGVRAIGYPVNGRDHGALVAALKAWDARARMGQLDHQARMQGIVGAGPTLIPVDRDYMIWRLRVLDGVREFARATAAIEPGRQVAWLRWVEQLPEFRALFSGGGATEAANLLGRWFCEIFIVSPALHGAALQTVQRLGQEFTDELFRSASWAAARLAEQDADAGRRWKTFLATSVYGHSAPVAAGTLLSYIPTPAPNMSSEPLPLLRAALRPYLVLKQRWSADEAAQLLLVPDAEVNWNSNGRTLAQHITRAIELAEPNSQVLGAVLEDTLSAAYDLLDAYHQDAVWDALSSRRSAIEPHGQDGLRRPVDPVIDGLRVYGERALAQRSRLPERWWDLDRDLFRRLALHILARDASRTADEKIEWLLDRSLLYETDLKHEVYAVLRAAVEGSSAVKRQRLLVSAQAGPASPGDVPGRDRHTAYATYNLLGWLVRSDPGWSEAADALAELQAANPTFAPREHPDFNRWVSSGTWGGKLPLAPEDFVQSFDDSPQAALDDLLAYDYSERNFEGPAWTDALTLVSQVVQTRPDLGAPIWSLVDARHDLAERANDLKRAIIEGWSKVVLGDRIDAAVGLVSTQIAEPDSVRSVSDFLLEQIRNHIESDETAAVAAMRNLALELWRTHGTSFTHPDGVDLTSFAPLYLNSWPGDLAQFWMLEVDRRWRKHRDDWAGLNEEEANALTQLLAGPSDAQDATRPAMANQLFFMFAADPEFTAEHILPLFLDDATAALAWGPYLFNARFNDKLLAAGLLSGAIIEWDRLEGLGDHGLREEFFGLVASIVSFAGITAEDRQRLLDRSVLAENGAHASHFADAVLRLLQAEGVDGAEVWKHWLGDHVKARLAGIPRTAAPSELERWANAVPYLGDSIPESIALLGGRRIGLGDGPFDLEFPENALDSYGPALVVYYAERIRHSSTQDYALAYEIGDLIESVRRTLGDASARLLEDAARERRFLPDGPD